MQHQYYFTPLYRWNRDSTNPKLSEYEKMAKGLSCDVLLTFEHGSLNANNKTYKYLNRKPYSNLFDIDCDVFYGDNNLAGEEWHIYKNGWVVFNVNGSGLPIVESYLGKMRFIARK